MSVSKVKRIIRNQLRYHLVKKKKANITNYYVETTLFSFVITIEQDSIVKTTLPEDNHYNNDGSGLSCTIGESCEALRQFRKAM